MSDQLTIDEPQAQSASDSQNHNKAPVSPPANPAFIPRSPEDIAIILCSLGLLACFFAPWLRSESAAFCYQFVHHGKLLWAIPLLTLATLALSRNKLSRRKLATITAMVVWLAVAYLAI